MTTTVRIDAHCSDDKEVEIIVADKETLIYTTILVNGGSVEHIVRDGRTVLVKEVLRQP